MEDDIKKTVEIADKLWANYRAIKATCPNFDEKDIGEKIAHFQAAGYNDFINKFTIPTRYMLLYNEYNSKAFFKYLKRLETLGYSSQDEWCERQADYVKLLWRAYNPHGNNAEAIAQWAMAKNNIKNELDGFKTDYEKAKIKAEEKHEKVITDHRETLKKLMSEGTDEAKLKLETLYKLFEQTVVCDYQENVESEKSEKSTSIGVGVSKKSQVKKQLKRQKTDVDVPNE
jgi:flagellar hook-basal body complex protein FliE